MEPVDQLSVGEHLAAAAAAGDWTAVGRLVDASIVPLLHDSPTTLLDALDRMPESLLSARPRLRLTRDLVARRLDRAERPATFRLVLADPDAGDDVDRLAVLTARAVAARCAGRSEDSVRLVAAAQDALRHLPADCAPPLAGLLPELHHQWGLTLERAGCLDEALTEQIESHDWSTTVGHSMVRSRSRGSIAYLHALHGRIAAARTWLDASPPPRPHEWWRASAEVQERLAMSLVETAELALSPGAPLQGIGPGEAAEQWASYFFVRAISIPDARSARLLRNELDTFLVSLPKGQKHHIGNTEYVEVARLLLNARAHELGGAHGRDRPGATAPFLRQLPAAAHALRLALAGKPRAALGLAAPLLQVDRSRPRILVLAMLATAVSTEGGRRRSAILEEAAAIAHAHHYYSAFTAIPEPLRPEAASLFADLGADRVVARLANHPRNLWHVPTTALSPRELAVAEHAAAGESVAEIAAALQVSVNTVKTQLRTVYRKLGIGSRAELQHLRAPG